MSCPAVIADLPAEFAGVNPVQAQDALDDACAMLPDAMITLRLGEKTALRAHVNAAAHLLTGLELGDGSVSAGTTKTERVGDVTETKEVASAASQGDWAGSTYGLVVAGILRQLPKNRATRRFPLAV